MRLNHVIVILILLCSCVKNEEKPTEISSYLKAKKMLDDKNYYDAAEAFDKIIDNFPFSQWSLKSHVMGIYAKYKNDKDDEVIKAADEFLTLYPSNEYTPYIIYMKGLVNYNKIPDISRSQDRSREAYLIFSELQSRFPSSQYSEDVNNKLNFINEHLAGELMSIGRYQIGHENYNGAAKSFYSVIKYYSQSNQAAEAYYRIAEIYHKIGLDKNAQDVIAILKKNHPNNYWTNLALNIK